MGNNKMKRRAVFFDRDGVINRLVFNPATGEYESPHREEDLELFPGVCELVNELKKSGFMLFMVSNQPSYAKGKTTMEDLKKIHKKLHETLVSNGAGFNEYYYCYHHPEGVVKGFSGECLCRKPKPYFLKKAKDKYALDMKSSWFVGDQDFDVLCGQAAGVKTILLNQQHSKKKRGKSKPDYFVDSLDEAVKIILNS